jgi:hypothetical protein
MVDDPKLGGDPAVGELTLGVALNGSTCDQATITLRLIVIQQCPYLLCWILITMRHDAGYVQGELDEPF